MKFKTVFISHLPIPNPNIGSWTNRYGKFVKNNNCLIDYIIAPKANNYFQDITYKYINEPRLFTFKISKLIKYYKHKVYWNALAKILEKEERVRVNIIDNPKILFAINYYSTRKNLNNRIEIIFHMCGYNYNFNKEQNELFYNSIDTLIIQTNSSIQAQEYFLSKGNCNVKQIYNGIEGDKFHKINKSTKDKFREENKIQINKLIFLWVSQDRPKKGLSIILEAWKLLVNKFNNIELLVIGTNKKEEIKGVNWLGKVENYNLPTFYQLSDFYLFSTQCNEGFGLTLGEALKCGVSCLASNIDPMKEILNNGEYGRLVDMPGKPKSWVKAIEQEIEKYKNNKFKNVYFSNKIENLYSYKTWSNEIFKIIKNV